MTEMHQDIETAVTEVLASATDQSDEFKRRLRKLVENATIGNLTDDDVREVIGLISVSLTEEE
ncbi:hypothetical protein QN224_31695 [Sinorhizobium sp. 8-89]|uniref:hypothetical protein n=1 Tax=Sinorhizobium sp. 7-81 TaxID=3049087 RepID=UPI0024C2576B|nr:hypothetical protein [Sinorhizobium sp. 7-81]MDK1389899.1 hypothetical protein [Sinorhizobium sp. 7-81]